MKLNAGVQLYCVVESSTILVEIEISCRAAVVSKKSGKCQGIFDPCEW